MRSLTGFHAIEELLRSALSSGRPPRGRLRVSGSGPRIKEILELAAKVGLAAERVSKAELDRAAPEHRGVLLEAEAESGQEAPASLEGYLAGPPEAGLVILLDHIEDPQNLGAILRSADAFAADLVVAPTRRSAPLSEAAVKASAGAAAYVPLALVPNLAEALRRLEAAGFWRYAADMAGEDVGSAELPARCAIVLGNEGSGVSRLVKAGCDGILSIPMAGHVDSLNVSASAAILMHEYRRRWPAGGRTPR
ncbi:MAG TPA: 23S rRNA (guanosine(2251)-2'-O)-methyltransferase RlmB [Spirochaetales bacterium]|nr:23S rRNA (guanosine(2251)-2'-O)-methyltransferase RlmB [Spirochaetales bacterium]HRY53156.1 23S rRNA (guanosine(2251)-2'-O)-methyltransferase RlmB [Spirochaetia bacterium]HRZ63303.1 23S rRNA (guanosine(2251)-2'-O)-methyltransferase RlmB [Spirochaetia bacterium]